MPKCENCLRIDAKELFETTDGKRTIFCCDLCADLRYQITRITKPVIDKGFSKMNGVM